jgi:hypothetical protein
MGLDSQPRAASSDGAFSWVAAPRDCHFELFDKGWPVAQHVRWFKTFAMNVSQIYDEDGEPVEMKIEQEAAN